MTTTSANVHDLTELPRSARWGVSGVGSPGQVDEAGEPLGRGVSGGDEARPASEAGVWEPSVSDVQSVGQS